MKNYRQLIKELPSKTVVFAFGRFNPPTTGHELLFKVIKKIASSHSADHVIYASRTQDKKKNPLSVDRKLHYLKLMFKGINFAAANEQQRTFMEVAKVLNKKYKNLIMVAGSDRVAEYEKLLNKYNGKEFNFDSIQVVSAGERDPDADDAIGMSASKIRAAATKGNYTEFKKGLPSSIRDIDGKLLMNELRSGMGLESIKEQIKLNTDELREKYFKGEIYHIGDLVESADKQYEIVDRGSNYLVVVDEQGDLHRKWIKDVQIVEIKNFKQFNEEVKSGEISYKGYTTKNLYKSQDVYKAFNETIEQADKGLITNDPVAILNALKAADQLVVEKIENTVDVLKKSLEKIGVLENHSYLQAIEESLSTKTIKPNQDKLKVARVIADMLGVDNPEKISNPEQLVNAGLRKVRSKQINPALSDTITKMLELAAEVGIKYDTKIIKAKVQENKDNLLVPDTKSKYNLASDILRYSDFKKLSKMNKGEVSEDMATSDYKTSKDGRKYRAHKINFANSKSNAKPDSTPNENEDENEDKKNLKVEAKKEKVLKVSPVKDDSDSQNALGQSGYDPFFKEETDEDISDHELDKMANTIDHEDDILDLYDDDEIVLVDAETGEVIKEEIEPVMEVLSRTERIRARTRFARTASKRERKVKIALKRYSSSTVVNSRARRLAIKLMKKRLVRGRDLSKISVGEKERIERTIAKRKKVINRLAMRLVPKIRQIEKSRLTHSKVTQGSSNAVF